MAINSVYEIPLIPQSQTLEVTILGVSYFFAVSWRNAAGLWFLDIMDVSQSPIVLGIPLVTGTDLLAQYAYLGLGFAVYVISDGDPMALPTFDNLGLTSHLDIGTP